MGDDTLQATIDSRLRRSARKHFFDDEDGDDDATCEPDDLPAFVGIIDRRGLPDFHKATKYTGTWLGMVFKKGISGMGYYRDDRRHHLCLVELISASTEAAPVALCLNEVIAAPIGKRAAEPATCPRRKRTSAGRKGEGVGLEIEWPKDDSLAASSSFHVTQGHWAFDSVNGSCWNTAAEYLSISAADFVAIQETKIPLDTIDDTEQAARNKGWSTAINPCIVTAAEGKSAGTAVCSRTQIGSKNSFADEGGDGQLQARFQMKHFGAVCKGGIHFGSCYLHCNWAANRKTNLDLLDAIGARIGTLRGPWIIGGDWQCPPTTYVKLDGSRR